MTRTIAYVRVSTEKQADKGVSLDAQQAKVAATRTLRSRSRRGRRRCRLQRENARAPGPGARAGHAQGGKADALLVVKLDRLTRSVVDLGRLVQDYFAPGKWALSR